MAVAPAAGAGAALSEGVIGALGLVALLGYLVATGTLKVYAHSLGYLIRLLAHELDLGFHIPWIGDVHPFGQLSTLLTWADTAIRDELAALALGYEDIASWAFARASQLFWWVGREIGDLAYAMVNAITHTATVTVPNAVLGAEHRVAVRIGQLEHSIDLELARARAKLAGLAVGIDRLRVSLTHTLERDIGWARTRIGHLERTAKIDGRRLARLEHRLGLASFTALVGVALSRLGLRWLRCANVGRAGKALCGSPMGWLDDLLNLLVDFTVLSEICQVLPWLEAGFREVEGPIVGLVTEAGAALCHGEHQAAAALSVPTLHLPAAAEIASLGL